MAGETPKPQAQWAKLPIRFEPNVGQAPAAVQYIARGAGYHLALESTRAGFVFRKGGTTGRLEIELLGADAKRSLRPDGAVLGMSNYLAGTDASKWKKNVPNYARVTAREVYPGIDVTYYGAGQELEYDFHVTPGANPKHIRMRFTAAGTPRVDSDGNLLLETGIGPIRQRPPVAYQEKDGNRNLVASRYSIGTDGSVGFELGAYDRETVLTIDPALVYGTYLGGVNPDEVRGVAVDSTGAAYVTGFTESADFPYQGPMLGTPSQYGGLFVTKINPEGTSMVYSTYIGAARPTGIAVDATGAVYVCGYTGASDFPMVNAVDSTLHPGSTPGIQPNDAIVFKLNPAGTALVYSTYLGGNNEDWAQSIAVDATGAAFIGGHTRSRADFPLKNAYKGTANFWSESAFVTKLTPAGNSIEFSTYFGGTYEDFGREIALDGAGNVYLFGWTNSSDLPLLNAYYLTYTRGGSYVAKFSSAGALQYSTFTSEPVLRFAVDTAGAVYMGGWLMNSGSGIYVSKLAAGGGGIVFTKSFPVNAGTEITKMAVTGSGQTYLTGYTQASNFPLVNAFDSLNDGANMFLMRISASGTTIEDSTLIGESSNYVPYGLAIDETGGVWLAGITSSGLPVTGIDVKLEYTEGFLLKFKGPVTTVPITIQTVPPGLTVGIDGTGYTAPVTVDWAPGSSHNLMAVTPQYKQGTVYDFANWSNGFGQSGIVPAPSAAATYTATYTTTACAYGVSPVAFNLAKAAQSFTVYVTATPGCPWTKTNSLPWVSESISDGYTYVTFSVTEATTSRSGTLTVAGTTITVNQGTVTSAPSAPIGIPSTTVMSQQVFTIVANDLDGASDISRVYFLVNDTPTAQANSCHGFYEPDSNKVYLFNDDLTQLSAPITLESSEFARNTQCGVYGHSSSRENGISTSVRFQLGLALRGTFAARSQKLYLLTKDKSGKESGWVQVSTWNVGTPVGNTPPFIYSLIASSPAGSPQVLPINGRDIDGGDDVARLYFLVANTAVPTAGGCHGFYDRAANGLYLYDDGLSVLMGPIAPGSASSLQNSQCIVNASTTSAAVVNGVDLRINLGIGLKLPFAAIARNVYSLAEDKAGANTGWSQMIAWLPGTVQRNPSVVSGTPANATGSPQTFTFTGRDPDGFFNIGRAYFLVNASPSIPGNTCHGFYDPGVNGLFLYSDGLSSLLGPLAPGSPGTLENSQCTIHGATSTTGYGTGTDLTFTLGMSLKGTFGTTSKNVYLWIKDNENNDTGWVQTSIWSPGISGGNQPPVAVSGTPANPTGSPQTFTFTGRDLNGFANISRMYFLVNPNASIPGNTCHGFYDRATNALFLYNDALSAVAGPLTPGTSGTLENSQCTIHGPISAAGSGSVTDLAVTIGMSLKGTFGTSSKNVYLWVKDNENNDTGWVQTSTWSPRASGGTQPPAVVSGSLLNVIGSPQTFTWTGRDPDGFANISRMFFLVNPNASISQNTCHGFYDRAANALFLYNDALTAVLGPLTPGTAGTLQNSQCTIDGLTSTPGTGSGTDIVVKVGISLTGTFARGTNNGYLWVKDAENNDTGWVEVLSWLPQPNLGPRPPTVASGAPTNPAGSPQAFTFIGQDWNGYEDMQRVYFLVNPNTSITQNTCHGFYDRASNAIFLYNDTTTAVSGPLTPGSAGTLRNSQCTIHGPSSAGGTGIGLQLSVGIAMSLTGTFATTTQNVYVWIKDASNNDTGWVKTSTWNPPPAGSGNAPTVVSGTPVLAAGSPQTFTFLGRDPNGFSNIQRVYFLVNGDTTIPVNGCHGFYDGAANAFFLYNDGLTAIIGPLAPGAAGTLQNSQCKIHGSASTPVSGAGTDLTITQAMSLTGSFGATAKNVYVWVKDADGHDTGWVKTSTWNP